jgi:proline racemase
MLHDTATVTIRNVPSYRKAKGVIVTLPDGSHCTGDVAWGGNWFFLINDHGQELALQRSTELLAYSIAARDTVRRAGFPEVDHVELFGPPGTRLGNSRNFVLCPGGAYDRSPCGTGTSAKLACLAADGKLAEGADWVQESIVGSTFTARYRWIDQSLGTIAPEITGSAYITAETTLMLDPADPFCWGIGPQA